MGGRLSQPVDPLNRNQSWHNSVLKSPPLENSCRVANIDDCSTMTHHDCGQASFARKACRACWSDNARLPDTHAEIIAEV